MWPLLLLPLFAFAETETEPEALKVQEFEQALKLRPAPQSWEDTKNKFAAPHLPVTLEKIQASGVEYGAIGPRKTLYDLEGKVHLVTREHFFVKYYPLPDEFGYNYLLQEDGSIKYKILNSDIEPTKLETDLYVPPHRYTPAPTNIVRTEYDQRLMFNPALAFYAGIVNGSYMKDLFDDSQAQSGLSTQFGLHATANWKLPVKAGLALHYEKTSYSLSGGGKAVYSSYNFGPLFKSADFALWDKLWRAQLQFRVSPFSRVDAATSAGDVALQFNSADLLIALEHPIKNDWGEFVIGGFFQNQWLNLRNQQRVVNVRATNETNKTFGLTFSQVIE